MMILFYFCFVLFVANANGDTACDKTKCVGEQKLYKEIGCTPVIEEGHCCASRYECPDFSTLDGKKCHFMNESFEVRSKLPMETTTPLCSASCYCREAYESSPAKFECAQIECPELFHREPDCIYQIEKGKCCSKNKVCGDDRNALPKCVLDGREYHEGEKMHPNSCHSCICTKDFDNTTVVGNPHCWEVDCGIQLRNMARLQTGCVPVYFGSSTCCPIDWRCPGDKDKVEPKGKSESSHKCTFGSLKLNVGDELEKVLNVAEEGITCTCATPPFIQCVKTYNN